MLLLEAVCSPRRLITVTICDAGRLHTWLRRHELNATTLTMAGSSVPYALRRRAYKRLPVFERLFCRFKRWRRFATRYDSLAYTFLQP